MLRSMYSGISGMKVNQTKLDVIGNNISNVGTTAFKSSTARFSDMLSQNVSDAMAPSNNKGGVNASQVGLGVQLASIATVMTQGTMQPTNRALDVAIDGEGFLMVSKGPHIFDGSLKVNHQAGSHNITGQSGASSQIMYTRDGALTLDEEGNLLTGDGYRVLGYSLTNDNNAQAPTGVSPNPVKAGGFDFVFGPGSQLNGYKIVLGKVGPNTTTSASVDNAEKTITLNGDFSTPGALTPAQAEAAVNKALSTAGISQSVTVKGKATNISNLSSEAVMGGVDAKAPNTMALGGLTIEFPTGDDYNGWTVKLDATGTTNDVTEDAANKVLTIKIDKNDKISDINKELSKHNIVLSGTISQSLTTETSTETIEGGLDQKAPDAIDIAGIKLNLTEGADLNGYKFVVGTITKGTSTGAEVDTDKKTITINGDFVSGKISQDDIKNAINAALSDKGINQRVDTTTGTVDQISENLVVSGETMGGTPVASMNEDGSIVFVDGTKDLKSYDGELKTLRIPEKVRMPGSNQELRITTYTIDANGVINGVLEDGRVAALGQIAMASFKNSEGLVKMGGNLYNASVNSGDAVIKSGIGTVDDDNSKGYGDTIQGMLEMSNVDLAEQFTDMIVATKAFQAASKMINTGDEILQEIINLKR